MIRLTDLLKEVSNYDSFFKKEQEYFITKPSYNEYVKKMEEILPKNDKPSIWLLNHHAAEIAWEEGKKDRAKFHIELAMKNNTVGNSITFVLDFIINAKGTKEELEQDINAKISDSVEKKTALKLLNDPKYGGTLK
jgi:hypothetical protein